MDQKREVSVRLKGAPHDYRIIIGDDLLASSGEWARRALSAQTSRVALVSNPKVFRLYGQIVRESLEKQGFEVFVWLMPDGEKHKNLRSAEKLLRFLSEHRMARTDAVAALGGGVVGDLAGFAAAVYLRGVAFLQIPTTLLVMIDSSVGGKTGVNSDFGKNLIGAFHQPHGVLIDILTLRTLHRRELTAGFCEAVKHGAVSRRELFDETARFLQAYPVAEFRKFFSDRAFFDRLSHLLSLQVAFKAEIVANDEKESASRDDRRSRKILNFGHTLGHALEKATDYRYFKHGEAVGYGILFAAELAKELEILHKDELNLLNDVMRRVGALPATGDIDIERVYQAFAFDKKNIGRSLQWILLEAIGKPVIVSGEAISEPSIRKSLIKILKQ